MEKTNLFQAPTEPEAPLSFLPFSNSIPSPFEGHPWDHLGEEARRRNPKPYIHTDDGERVAREGNNQTIWLF